MIDGVTFLPVTDRAVCFEQPYCPTCLRQLLEPPSMPDGVTAFYAVECLCGWKGQARFFVVQSVVGDRP